MNPRISPRRKDLPEELVSFRVNGGAGFSVESGPAGRFFRSDDKETVNKIQRKDKLTHAHARNSRSRSRLGNAGGRPHPHNALTILLLAHQEAQRLKSLAARDHESQVHIMGLPRYPICSAVSWDGVCVGPPAVWDAACTLLCRCLANLHNPSALRTQDLFCIMTWSRFLVFLCCSFQH